MSQNPEMQLSETPSQNITKCSNCHSAMPSELRFCRNCGFRLGEDIAEYTETVRFDNGRMPSMPIAPVAAATCAKKRRRMSGMAWMFVGLLIFFVAAAGFTAVISPHRQMAPAFTAPVPPRSYVGVDSFDTTDGGATFNMVEAPGLPSDKAGLVGGDIVTTFDGQAVHDEDQMMEILVRTPIGKTVDVVYLRDGETKTTKLTTISQEEHDRIMKAFRNRPQGRAQFGYDDGDAERVPLPGTKIFGVKLGNILQSRPADLAGIKQGDIVIEFDGIPIRTPEEFRARVQRSAPYSTVKVVVMRPVGEKANETTESSEAGDDEGKPGKVEKPQKFEKLEIPVKMGKQ
jgi:membrane-associated protease RseP (regulator of RpoE activity)